MYIICNLGICVAWNVRQHICQQPEPTAANSVADPDPTIGPGSKQYEQYYRKEAIWTDHDSKVCTFLLYKYLIKHMHNMHFFMFYYQHQVIRHEFKKKIISRGAFLTSFFLLTPKLTKYRYRYRGKKYESTKLLIPRPERERRRN